MIAAVAYVTPSLLSIPEKVVSSLEQVINEIAVFCDQNHYELKAIYIDDSLYPPASTDSMLQRFDRDLLDEWWGKPIAVITIKENLLSCSIHH